jgi:hypothetical protein
MAAAGFAAMVPVMARAQAAAAEPKLDLTSAIDANHGHDLKMTPVEALQLLRSTKVTGPVSTDIRGQSGHGHALVLDHAALVALFVDGQVKLQSSSGSHNHGVTIKLDVI